MTGIGLQLGPPGVYLAGVARRPEFRAVRLDVAGFVGVAPRGPVDQPVAVESWSDYRWRFGGYEGPGLLPWAVRTFFAQGGRRAYVCRVSPLPRPPVDTPSDACAAHAVTVADASGVPVDLPVLAADEGSWGTRLKIRCGFVTGTRFRSVATAAGLVLPEGTAPPPCSLLRVRGDGLPAPGAFRWVESVGLVDDGSVRVRVAVPDRPLPEGTFDVDVVTLRVEVRDPDPSLVRSQTLSDLGLRLGHPRFAARVLGEEDSLLVRAGPEWPERFLPEHPSLPDPPARLVRPGVDRYEAIGRDSLYGDRDPLLLPVGGIEVDGPRLYGVDLMSLVPEVALLAVPDLCWSYSEPAVEVESDRPVGSPVFVPCQPPRTPTPYAAPAAGAVRLDGRFDLPEILDRQRRLVALAERQRRFVALLDVPEHLPVPAIVRWRHEFDSSYAAAYHPWLGLPGEAPPGSPTVRQPVPPSAVAAGIISARERGLGIAYGPANELAREVVIGQPVAESEHAALHDADIGVFRPERDGYRLTSAHTLARDPDYRQLSVRRLMTMLRLVLDRQSQWLVFEPHTPVLRRQLRDAIVQLLRDLYRRGAFTGETEAEAFFVRCDEAVNPGWSSDLGRLVAEVGVAPAHPLEYLLLRISQDTDGTVRVEG